MKTKVEALHLKLNGSVESHLAKSLRVGDTAVGGVGPLRAHLALLRQGQLLPQKQVFGG